MAGLVGTTLCTPGSASSGAAGGKPNPGSAPSATVWSPWPPHHDRRTRANRSSFECAL